MRNLLTTLVLASAGLVLGTGEASAFFRKKHKCHSTYTAVPVVTHTASSCCGTPSYAGSGYSAMPSAFPAYSGSNYGNYGYNTYGYGGNTGYNNYGYGGNTGYNNYGYGAGRSLMGTAGSVGSGILSMPGNLYNRFR